MSKAAETLVPFCPRGRQLVSPDVLKCQVISERIECHLGASIKIVELKLVLPTF